MKRVVTYSVAPRRNPQEKDTPPKFYGVAVSNGKLELEDLAEEISQRCTVKIADVVGVIKAFSIQFRKALLAGEIVSLDHIGNFRVTCSGKGSLTEEDFKESMIETCHVRFHPCKVLRDTLAKVKYSKRKAYLPAVEEEEIPEEEA